MVDPGAVARCDWPDKIPLADQWRGEVSPQTEALFPDRRNKLLAFWIEKSETDDWTFDQLCDLIGAVIIDAGEEVPALNQWALEVAARRRKLPTRTGPKGDRVRDFDIAAIVEILSECGMSKRAAKRTLADVYHKSEEAIESARARGLQHAGDV